MLLADVFSDTDWCTKEVDEMTSRPPFKNPMALLIQEAWPKHLSNYVGQTCPGKQVLSTVVHSRSLIPRIFKITFFFSKYKCSHVYNRKRKTLKYRRKSPILSWFRVMIFHLPGCWGANHLKAKTTSWRAATVSRAPVWKGDKGT